MNRLIKCDGEYYGADASQKSKVNYVDGDDNIYILGEFDESINELVVPYLIKMISSKENMYHPEINIYINSNGGLCHVLHNMLCLLDVARSKGFTINTTIMGRAYSCGSLLACYGDHRRIFKYGNHLMHFGQTGTDVTTPMQNKRVSKHIEEHFESLVDIYAAHSKLSKEKIRELMNDDCLYLNAEECLKYGLVDEIIGGEINQEKETKIIKCPSNGYIDVEADDCLIKVIGENYNKGKNNGKKSK